MKNEIYIKCGELAVAFQARMDGLISGDEYQKTANAYLELFMAAIRQELEDDED